MKFHYKASDPRGKIIEGKLDASSSYEVLNSLAQKGLRPISIKLAKNFDIDFKKIFESGITVEDKVFLTKYLYLMLKGGTDLFGAINILIQDFNKPILKSILIEIRNTLEKGQPFYITFAKYPKHFSSVFTSLVKAGEVSGNLETVFYNLSISLKKEQELRSKIQSAFVYPIILLSMATVLILLLVTFALPKIGGIFTTAGFDIPFFSQIVFATGNFINDWKMIVFPGILALIIASWYFFTKTLSGRKLIARIISKIPVVNKLLKQMALQRFAATFSSLMKAGLPILDALEITAESVGSEELRQVLLRISRDGLAKGLTIGQAFHQEPYFPGTVTNLISVSEKAGHTEEILKTLAVFYESEIEGQVKNIVTFIEPMLLLFMGLVIGGIALAVIVPVYQLVGGM
ncbi:type II secretion system F family protein [Patescibacteria group bacterium]|nr:type II secretion system F family protein [Patescibacteria group bacterium]